MAYLALLVRRQRGRDPPLSGSGGRAEVVDAWMEAMGDETDLAVPASALAELRGLMLETIRRMATGEMPHGHIGTDNAQLTEWFKQQMNQEGFPNQVRARSHVCEAVHIWQPCACATIAAYSKDRKSVV